MWSPRWTVQIVPYGTGGFDPYGNPIEGYGEPVDAQVYGWGPAGSQELTGWTSQVTADLALYAPAGFTVGPRDRIIVNGKTYDVVGEVQDFTHGPHGWDAGVRVDLTRVEG